MPLLYDYPRWDSGKPTVLHLSEELCAEFCWKMLKILTLPRHRKDGEGKVILI